MDSTATSLCKDNNISMIVFNLHKQGNIDRVLKRRARRYHRELTRSTADV